MYDRPVISGTGVPAYASENRCTLGVSPRYSIPAEVGVYSLVK